MTKYAEDIYGCILETRSHPTAEQIFLALKQKNPKISQATVYNNLNALVTAGRLIRLSEAGCPDRYDNTSRHDHLICVRCGALSDRTLSDLTASIEEQIGCGILSYDLRVRWLCPACRAVERGSACSAPPHLS